MLKFIEPKRSHQTFAFFDQRGSLRLACISAVVLTFAPLLHAQVATGDILGKVSDQTGAIVPGATVRVENVGTHQVRSFQSGSNGEYVFSLLQPGTYQVTVTSPNYKTFQATNVVVSASDRIRIDAPLQVGAVEERVEVTTTPTALQTDSTTVGSTITEKTLLDVPLNGRNFIGLVQVQAGVNAGSPNSLSSGANIVDRRQSSSVSANGQEELFNNNMLDGLDNNSRTIGTLLIRPSVEAIGEVRTDINLYTAEVGRTGGAAINVITKSGTNQFHGSVYEFFRNDITDSRNFFAPASLLTHKPKQRQNQYGGSLAGPIFHDRTFFFIDYEGLRLIDGNNSVYISTVPTIQEEAAVGDLTDITNPFTGKPVYTTPIPTASLDPTGVAYFKLYPAPNRPATNGANNFIYNPAASLYSSLGDLRIDHHFSERDTLFGRYSYNRTQAYTPPYLPGVNGVQAGGIVAGTLPGNNLTTAHNGQFAYTHVFTPSLIMELRTGYTYFNLDTTPLNYGNNLNNQAPYLIPNANQCGVCSGLATFSVVGYAGLGDPISQPFYNQEHNTQFAGAVTYSKGRHTFKAGAALIRRNFSFQLPLYPKGLFIFAPTAVAATKTYVPAFQKLLTGTQYVTMRQAQNAKPYDRTYEPSFYLQDDWHASDRLTLNMGLRYDVYTKPNEKNGNNAVFNLTSFSVVDSATGGLENTYHDFSPRFGFDATVARGMVVRGGFGLTFFPGDSNNSLVLNNPPFGFNSGTVFHAGTLATQGIGPITVQSTATASLSGAVTAKPTRQTDSYLEQFNLLVQKEYRGTVVTAGYVAELGRHIVNSSPNIDLPDPQIPGPTGAAPAARFAAQLPNITGINYFGNFGASSYNSVQVSVERRTSHGLTANVNYTYAHNLDDVLQVFSGDGLGNNGFGLQPFNVSKADYGNSPLDIAQRFAGFFSYDIPTGKSGSHLYKAVAGGFRLNGLGFWQTGAPFTVTDATTQANGLARINLSTITADKPNVVGTINSGGGSLTQFFNTSAFAAQPIGTPGNEARNQVFGPHLRRGDLSLFKTVPIREGVKVELRAECFNFTNTPNFAQPNAIISAYGPTGVPLTANGFGTITSTAYGYSGRQFQFAGRFVF